MVTNVWREPFLRPSHDKLFYSLSYPPKFMYTLQAVKYSKKILSSYEDESKILPYFGNASQKFCHILV